MFVSDTHLPQLLSPAAYFDQAWFHREKEHIFRSSWWAVATLDEFQRDGDFVTLDHVHGPVILWRKGGEINAFLNVCAHRLSKLTAKPVGHGSCLRCEYHGWEYDESGATRQIPDAPAFRPLERGELGLRKLKTATVGAIVFVTFAEDACSIEEWLGDEAERITKRFGRSTRTLWKSTIDIPVNWKLLLENNLESYHVTMVHGNTLGNFPDEGACHHDFAVEGSRFTGPGADATLARFRCALARRIDSTITGHYSHAIVYPGFTWLCVDLLSGFQSIVPTGPRTCRMTVRFAAMQDQASRSLMNWMARLCVSAETRFWRRVINEDLSLLPLVQAGAESEWHPGSGLISRREERIVHFQRWILSRMGECHDQRHPADGARRGQVKGQSESKVLTGKTRSCVHD